LTLNTKRIKLLVPNHILENEQSQDLFVIKNIESSRLVKRFQDGEMEAFDEIVERYRNDVYRIAYGFTHNCEDAYDISQDIFIKVFKSLNKLKMDSTFNIWLRKIVMNTCIDYLRQKSKEQLSRDPSELVLESITCADSNLPDHRMEIRELRNMIFKAIERLPNRRKKVFILRHYENLSLEEIAQTLDCSVGTVKAHLFKACHDLRNFLSPYLLS